MRFIQTLFLPNEKNLKNDSFGWFSPKHHLIGWAFSCLQINKFHTAPYLYCSKEVKKVFEKHLHLPYNTFMLFDEKFTLPYPNLWAMPKIIAYSKQQSPFIHIDGDVLLFDRLPEQLLSSKLIAQNTEVATQYYKTTQKEILLHFDYLPEAVANDFGKRRNIRAVNAGILGGSDIRFFKHYTKAAMQYIYKNQSKLGLINGDRFNIFFEQHLFYALAVAESVEIRYLFKKIFKDNLYDSIGEIHTTPYRNTYIHLLGHFKRDILICKMMEEKFKDLYPSYYERINDFLHHTNLVTIKKNNNPNALIDNFTTSILTPILKPEYTNHDKRKKDFEKLVQNSKQRKISITLHEKFDSNWFNILFKKNGSINQKIKISKSNSFFIIKSRYNWSGLYNKKVRTGVRYYHQIEAVSGKFYNLFSIEIETGSVMLFDIDDFEYSLLQQLKRPRYFNDLFKSLLELVDDDIVTNHKQVYRKFVITIIKDLFTKKILHIA
jgi:hypothetical protein